MITLPDVSLSLRSVASICRLLALALVIAGCSDGSDDLVTPVSPMDMEVTDLCNLPVDDVIVFTTEAGIEYVRTPNECFDALLDYPFEPSYAVVDGLQMHYVDEGPEDGELILLMHGQPSWSYLYRKMIPVLVDAGYRVIAPDHIGMGRSDKPTDPRTHTYEQQVAWNKAFITQLGLGDITLFVQDWGSLIGLRVAGEMPEFFARIVLANGDLPLIPPGVNPFTVPVFKFDEMAPGAEEFFAKRSETFVEGFQQWIDYAASAGTLFPADVVQLLTVLEIPGSELSAYDAPFPDPLYWGAIRAFPSMIAGINGEAFPAYAALGRFDRPFLALAGEFDTNLGTVATQTKWINHVPGAVNQDHRRYEAHHFIQEDAGEAVAEQVVEFMRRNPVPDAGPLYNFRYCEIFLLRERDTELEAEVYATIGLNFCPQDAWDAIDLGAVALEQGALSATANGPRYWVLDMIAAPSSSAGEVTRFGEMEMRQFATFAVSESSSAEPEPYVVGEVARSTLYTYVAGRRIFALEDAEGRRYVMQSMSQQIDSTLQLHDLPRLDQRLALPAGWTFSTTILEEPLELRAEGIARVVTDELRNTYQMIE